MSEWAMFVGALSVRDGLRFNIPPFFPFTRLWSLYLSPFSFISAGTYGTLSHGRPDPLSYIWALFDCHSLFILNFRHSLLQYLKLTQGLPD